MDELYIIIDIGGWVERQFQGWKIDHVSVWENKIYVRLKKK